MSEQLPAPSKTCSNCKQAIEATKHRLHESTCARNTVKCQECGDILSKCLLEQHEFDYHQITTCEYCQDFESDRQIMKEHLEYCTQKPLQCPYCELKIPQLNDGYTKHISYCESKTRLCDDCGKQIQQKFFEPHILNGECMLNQAEKREKEVRMNKLYFEKFKNEQVLRAKEIKEQKAAVQTTLTKPNQQTKVPSQRNEKSYKEKVLGKNKVQVQLDESDETPNTKKRTGQDKGANQGNSQRIKEQIQEESQKKRLSKQQDREKKAAVKKFF